MNNSRKEAKPTADWISVEDRLPETGKAVLVARFYWTGDRVITRGFYAAKHTLEADNWEDCEWADYDIDTDTCWCPEGWHEEMTSENCDYFYMVDGVTHWMPLPALPGVEMMTNKSPDTVMTATEAAERSEALITAIRERESITANSIGDKMATVMADLVIKHISDDLSPQAWLERLIAIRDGKND